MEFFKILMPLLVTAFTTVFINRYLFNKGIRNLKRAKEFQDLFNKYETSFKNEFILPDLEESYFYAQTGIKTNKQSIDKYINFKNKLGVAYTWDIIRDIKPFLNIENREITINLKTWHIAGAQILLFLGLLLGIIGIGIFYYFSQFLYAGEIKEFIEMTSIMIFFVISGCYFLTQSTPGLLANRVQKRLKTISIDENADI